MPLKIRVQKIRVNRIQLAVAPSGGGGGGNNVLVDTSAKDGGVFSGGGVSTIDLSITVASNSDRALYVFVCGGGTAGAEDVSGVSSSVNGAFTDVGTATDSNFCWVSGWRLLNPTAGAHTITATLTNFTTTDCELFAVSLYNVNQSTPNDTVVTTSGSSTSPSASATLSAGQMAIAALMSDDDVGVAVTVGSQLQETENIGGANDTSASMGNNTGTGSVAVTWSQDNTGWAVLYIPVKPS